MIKIAPEVKPKPGDIMTYMSFAGPLCKAWVVGIRDDGSVDIDIDGSYGHYLKRTRIKVVDRHKLERGKCCVGWING